MHSLFLSIQIYSCTLKFYCRECFYFIVKCNILCSVWENEEMDHKILSLFFLIFKFLQTFCYRCPALPPPPNCLEDILTALLPEWGGYKCNGEGVNATCNSNPKPGMKSSIVTEFSWGNLFCILIAAPFFKLKCSLKIID